MITSIVMSRNFNLLRPANAVEWLYTTFNIPMVISNRMTHFLLIEERYSLLLDTFIWFRINACTTTPNNNAEQQEGKQMIIVVAALRFETQVARDKAVELTKDVQLATREEEAGCHDYCFAPDPSIPTRIQVYELWEDGDSLAAHFTHANYQKMVDVLGDAGILPVCWSSARSFQIRCSPSSMRRFVSFVARPTRGRPVRTLSLSSPV